MLVRPETLKACLRHDGGETSPVVIDCRFDLADAGAGRQAWRSGRIPGAVYAHLDDDLAAPVCPDTGRHPLPEPGPFAGFLARSGWTPGRDIVAYDAQGGAFAARLWWLMRYFGHDCVRLLDGGLSAWTEAGYPLQTGAPEVPPPAPVATLQPRPEMIIHADDLQAALAIGSVVLLDARAADRFAGQNESIDPVAGHVTGAKNLPFSGNLEQGHFLASGVLAKRLATVIGDHSPGEVVNMCGSGVTACHNLFAMSLAGLEGARLYPGSWSEWIRDPSRPVSPSRVSPPGP